MTGPLGRLCTMMNDKAVDTTDLSAILIMVLFSG